MHFLRLTAHPADRPEGAFDCSQIQVVVNALDLFRALERTVDTLQVAGWIVDDLEQFHIAVCPPSAAENPELRRLYSDAKTERGVAWALIPGSVSAAESETDQMPEIGAAKGGDEDWLD